MAVTRRSILQPCWFYERLRNSVGERVDLFHHMVFFFTFRAGLREHDESWSTSFSSTCHQTWRGASQTSFKMWLLMFISCICTRMQKRMAAYLSQWRAFKNQPCAREHTSCIYMCGLPSPAQCSVCECVCSTFLPSAPKSVNYQSCRAHLWKSTGPRFRHTLTHACTHK